MADEARKIYAVQFHPEVHHSVDGDTMLRNFLFKIAKITPDWTMSSFVERVINEVRETVGDGHVVCALSGGVDSTVVAVLLHKAIGKNLHCIFVDNGVLRSGEGDEVVTYLREHFDLNLKLVNAQDRFLDLLAGVEDPEKKRKIIGHTFIDVFDEGGARHRQRGMAGSGDPLSRRDRVRVPQGAERGHQEPPQRGRIAGKDEHEAHRAAA